MHPYKLLLQQFNDYLLKANPAGRPVELYNPIQYIMGLGGKRMRPLLVMAGCDLFNGENAAVLPIAYAMELFHNFTLVHDDIMDNAAIRRGQPTVHEKYGFSTAILSGDVMQVYVYERLMEAPAAVLVALLKVFNDTAIKVCEGQQMDMNFETQSVVSVEEYIAMITNKTAVLLGCCLQCGAMIGGAAPVDAQRLYDYGLNMGIAFQVQDDLLDTFGGEEFGKQIGGDIRQNKKTLLLIKAMELSQGRDKEELEYQLAQPNDTDEKVRMVKDIYIKLGIKEIAEQLMLQYHQKALAALNEVNAEKAKKQLLSDYAGALLVREN